MRGAPSPSSGRASASRSWPPTGPASRSSRSPAWSLPTASSAGTPAASPGRPSLHGMDDRVNLAEKLALLEGPFQPGIVGYLNDYKLEVVKILGEFVWHKH